MATNEILQILVFSCFFGFAIASLKAEPAGHDDPLHRPSSSP